jgi:glutaredoxin
MNKKTNTIIAVGVVILIFGVIIVGSKAEESGETPPPEVIAKNSDSETEKEDTPAEEHGGNVLYWGTTCPACKEVMSWIEENEVDQKLTIIQKEVYENRQNSLELTQKARECGMDTRSIAVPLMYTAEEECLVGYPDIIEYLEIELQEATEEESAQEEIPSAEETPDSSIDIEEKN